MLDKFIKFFIVKIKSRNLNWIVIISLTFSLSFLISTGPWIQFHLLSIVISDSTSIYNSVYGNGFARFPSLIDWIKDGLNPSYLLISFLISYITLTWKSLRQILWASSMTSFVFLSLLDVLNGFLYQSLNVGYVFKNLIGNFFGGILLGFIVVIFLILFEICLNHIPTKKNLRYINASLLVICLGVFSTTIIFYIGLFFFKPIPVEIDIVLDPPISAEFGNIDRKTEAFKKNSFKTINLSSTDFQSRFLGNGGDIFWEAPSKNNSFNIKISFHEGCFDSDKIEADKTTLNLSDVTSLKIVFDEGLTNFSTFKNKRVIGSTILETEGVSQFWLNKMKASPFIEIQQPLFKKDKLTYSFDGGEVRYYVSGDLFKSNDKKRKKIIRTLDIQTDKKNFKVRIVPPENINWDDKIQCNSLKYKRNLQGNIFTVNASTLNAGLLVSINPKSKNYRFENVKESKLVLNNFDGILNLKNVNPKDTQQISGNLNFLQFWEKASQFKVNNDLVDTNKFDRYLIFGELKAYYRKDAEIRIIGKGKMVTNGSTRINQTKWEQLDWNYRSFLFGIFSFILFFICKIILGRLKSNQELFFL